MSPPPLTGQMEFMRGFGRYLLLTNWNNNRAINQQISFTAELHEKAIPSVHTKLGCGALKVVQGLPRRGFNWQEANLEHSKYDESRRGLGQSKASTRACCLSDVRMTRKHQNVKKTNKKKSWRVLAAELNWEAIARFIHPLRARGDHDSKARNNRKVLQHRKSPWREATKALLNGLIEKQYAMAKIDKWRKGLRRSMPQKKDQRVVGGRENCV